MSMTRQPIGVHRRAIGTERPAIAHEIFTGDKVIGLTIRRKISRSATEWLALPGSSGDRQRLARHGDAMDWLASQ
jgi:hypothetical protein